MKLRILYSICIMLLPVLNVQAKEYKVASPNGKLVVTVSVNKILTWAVNHEATKVILPSEMRMHCMYDNANAFTIGDNVKVAKATVTKVNSSFPTPFYKKAIVTDNYNQLLLKCNGGFSIMFRVYNEGASYRFVLDKKKSFKVIDELAEFNFAEYHKALVSYVNDNRGGERYCYSFESYYDHTSISKMYKDSLSITPLMIELDNGKKAVIMEAGVSNYPNMFLKAKKETANGIEAEFAPYPLECVIGGYDRLNLVPNKRANYIAEINAYKEFVFPWRVVLVTTNDTELVDNDMMQRLSDECKISDTSWIKPGKVSWDWWNTCNLTGVDFKAGMNTPTYKKYIDFAADNKLEYIIIDEGWSGKESLLDELSEEINLSELIKYGNEKGVGIIIWASWRNITGGNSDNSIMEKVISHYSMMGIKGFKVDFFDRDDQIAMASAESLAACAAKYKMLLDFHGLKPSGLQRAYPNILNFEGVKGLENSKWEPIINGKPLHDFPRYDVTAPFLRQLMGPMDYTPGAMVNATREMFRTINDHPMSQGTRVHQMAMYTVFEAPLQMLADSPSKYIKEQECTDFIAKVPTTFEETVALDSKIAEYITVARRKGDTWYIASMTDWTPRQINIDFSFLDDGIYDATIFCDGVNADREATDYKKMKRTITSKDRINIGMAPGVGWAAILTKKK